MLLFAFAACEKQPTFEEQSQNETEQTAGRFSGNPILADFENGRLVFENQEAFDQTIASLKSIEETDLKFLKTNKVMTRQNLPYC